MISIVIPYYNRPAKLQRCITSVLSQTYQDFEILIVDDCSNEPLILDMDSRVKVFRNDKNLGPGLSRNVGLDHAKGDFVAFLDSDDYWDKDFLKTLVGSLSKNPNAVMAYAKGYKVDDKGKVIGIRRKKKELTYSILPEILYKGRYWGTGGCLWRKKELDGIRFLSTRSWEDYAFDISVALHNNTVVPVNKFLVYYDVSGEDKLSNQKLSNTIIEKHKSITIISNLLNNSKYKDDPLTKKTTTILLLLNTIHLLKLKNNQKRRIIKNIKSLLDWQSFVFYVYVLLLTFFPNKLAIRYLMKLKRRVNQNKLHYFLK